MTEPASAPVETIHTNVCIVGGGPAGMMLGLLLARSGVEVVVLEKHADFFRDFRGDTIHPSTLELLHELGCLEEFLKVPHQPMSALTVSINGKIIDGPDFSRLPTRCKFVAFTPQWHFLDFVARQGKRYPTFTLRMETEATGLIEENGRIMGVKAHTPQGAIDLRARLVVCADGRNSALRPLTGLHVHEFGVPLDVLWFRLPKPPHATGGEPSFGYFKNGRMAILIDRGDYWQAANLIPKGALDQLKAEGIEAFRQRILDLVPAVGDSIQAIDDWDKVKLLSVQINRLEQWTRPGLLCIGDCAHAMSPAGGIGVNIAIQDAVAAANLLADKLRDGTWTDADTELVQKHRERAVHWTQNLQLFLHRKLLNPAQLNANSDSIPLPARLVGKLPFLRQILARIVGLGFQPEHIRTSEYRPA